MFECDKCGLCCINLSKSSIYADLDRGDGICINYDEKTHLCKIYQERPLKCNIDVMYEKYFKETMNKEEYYNMNHKSCDLLKSNYKF